ncbi:hypothetical protein GCM10009547_33880 [Sporichthya brevicatena]|uniref:Uncharacterized protein n=1 Tax=Sporichthya brevicatena TaxID=171442 RepID=A0ABP3S6F1_9ACTN
MTATALDSCVHGCEHVAGPGHTGACVRRPAIPEPLARTWFFDPGLEITIDGEPGDGGVTRVSVWDEVKLGEMDPDVAARLAEAFRSAADVIEAFHGKPRG